MRGRKIRGVEMGMRERGKRKEGIRRVVDSRQMIINN